MTDTLEPSAEAFEAAHTAYHNTGTTIGEGIKGAVRAAYAIDARPVVKALEWVSHPKDAPTAHQCVDHWDAMVSDKPTVTFYRVIRSAHDLYQPALYMGGYKVWKAGVSSTQSGAIEVAEDHFASLITQCLEPAAPVVSEEVIAAILKKKTELLDRLKGRDSEAKRLGLNRSFGMDDAINVIRALTPTKGGE